MLTKISFHISPSDYRWYVTNTSDTENVQGAIRSGQSGPVIYPELQFEVSSINITQCTTVR